MARPVDDTLQPRLIRAAAEQFARRGYGRCTMADVGEAAGVTKGGVYFHFRSKEQLFFAALDDWQARLRAATVVDAGASGAAGLRALVRGYLRTHFDDADGARLGRVLAIELAEHFTTELRQDARHEQRRLRAALRDLLARGVRDGSLFTDDAARAAFVLVGALDGIVQQWLTAPDDAAPFADADELTEALVAAYVTGREPADVDDAADGGGGAAEPGADLHPSF